MENKLKFKKVGDVEIFEFSGNLTGAFAAKSLDAMNRVIEKNPGTCILFNLQSVDSLNAEGAAALAQAASRASKKAFLLGENEIIQTLKRLELDTKCTLVKNPEDAAFLFHGEFAVKPNLYLEPERRQFIRLKTVLPLWFSLVQSRAKDFEFFGVVTNLSEGGLYVEFIDSASEIKAGEIPVSYEPQELKIQLFLSPEEKIYMQGQKVYGSALEGGIGVGFTAIDAKTRERLRNWVESHLVQHPEASHGQGD